MTRFQKTTLALATGLSVLALSGCAVQEQSRTVAIQKVDTAQTPYTGERTAVSIGKFNNRSSFMRGVFTDSNSEDRLGSQAQTILTAHLQQSQRFSVLDRTLMSEAKQEAQISGQAQAIKGAKFIITGDVTEFGRKEVGDQQFFGILGRGRTQVAYSKVTLNIVSTTTSEVVHSVMGAGEFSLSQREVIGFGSSASYDSTLNGKVLDLAIRDAINNLTQDLGQGRFKP
jgi:curli biogenesis system outer membrane secretion channel CsgG